MGTALGHGTTGLYFLAAGIWFFLRALDMTFTRPMRRNRWLLSLEPFGRLLAGIGYWVGEKVDMVAHNSHAMSHTSHLLMAGLFMSGGLLELMHVNRVVTGLMWPILSAITWSLIGTLFYWHPQDSVYLEVGHGYIFVVWILLTFSRIGEAISGRFVGRSSHHSRSVVGGEPTVSTVYDNPALYSTCFPGFSGFLLFLSGTWMWDLTMVFIRQEDKIRNDMDSMYAQYNFLKHFIVDLVLLAFLSIILRKIDTSVCSQCLGRCLQSIAPSERDEFYAMEEVHSDGLELVGTSHFSKEEDP